MLICFRTFGQSKDSTKVEDRVFIGVEKTAQFPGGFSKLSEYLDKNLRNPAHTQGRVFVQFIINRDGTLNKILEWCAQSGIVPLP